MATSEKQEAVYKEVKANRCNIAVQATAGAGKTTTLLHLLTLLPRLKKIIFLSFTNTIVKELKERVPKHVQASTLHSLGMRMIKSKYPAITVDMEGNKYFQAALALFDKKEKETYKKCFQIKELCNYARLTLTPFEEEDMLAMCNKFGLDATPECILIACIVLKELTQLKNIKAIDFTDMIYLPAVYPDLVNEQFDYVCVDEVQDLNAAQIQLIENIVKKNGRVIVVGDEKQAIYGFTGSDIDSFQKVADRFHAKIMPLTVTYRCAKAIVRLAQEVYPDVIEAWENSPEGNVDRLHGTLADAQPGDMVLCRNTRPLVSAFFYFVKKNKKSYVVGKEMEKGLIAFAEIVAANSFEKIEENIMTRLDNYLDELRDVEKDPETSPKYLAMLEKATIIELILTKISHPGQLVSKISEIFHPDNKAIKLLTIHRSKGLENEKVFFIEKFNDDVLLPSPRAILPDQKIQEQNLLFVCYTRAKKEFVFIDYKESRA